MYTIYLHNASTHKLISSFTTEYQLHAEEVYALLNGRYSNACVTMFLDDDIYRQNKTADDADFVLS